MIAYIGQRLVVLVPVLILVSSVVFSIMHVLPGDPIQLMLAGAEAGSVTPERMAELRKTWPNSTPRSASPLALAVRT